MAADEHLSPQQFYHSSEVDFEPGDVLRPHTRGFATNAKHVFVAPGEEAGRAWAGELHRHNDGSQVHLYEVRPLGKVTHSVSNIGLAQGTTSGAEVLRKLDSYGG